VARRKKKGSSQTVLGIVGIIACLGIIGGGVYLYAEQASKPGIDKATLCPENGPVGHLAILLDTTDPISMTQLQAARQRIEKQIDSAAIGTRISFATVSPDRDIRSSTFLSICKPAGVDDINAFMENASIVEERYRTGFAEPVDAALSGLMTVPEAETSPIMEALQEFFTTIPDFTTTDAPRELVVMTDLMQHSDTFSLYGQRGWPEFKGEGGTSRLSRNLDGMKVTILRIPRTAAGLEVDDFWVNYFDAQGVRSIEPIVIGDL
jgi:hypothetical protein